MAVPDNGMATPPKLEAHCPSQSAGTACATSGTAVRDGLTLLLLLLQRVGTSRACGGMAMPRFQTAILEYFQT